VFASDVGVRLGCIVFYFVACACGGRCRVRLTAGTVQPLMADARRDLSLSLSLYSGTSRLLYVGELSCLEYISPPHAGPRPSNTSSRNVHCTHIQIRGVVGRGRGGTASPTFFDGGRVPHSPLFGLKFVQKLVHCRNWLLTETQCKIISVQQN